MKKKVLCVFLLIFWVLGALTFLSMKTQEQMIPQVTTTQAQSESGLDQGKLPPDCLIETEEGVENLFTIYEGSGWEAGTRAQIFTGMFGYVAPEPPEEDYIIVDNTWLEYIQYTSKPLQSEDLIEVIRSGDRIPDHWLALFPEGAPDLSGEKQGIVLEEQSDSAALFSVEKATQPFMEGRARSEIPALKGAKVYSFVDMIRFLDALPLLGLLLAIFVAALLLWIFSCFLSKDAKHNRVFLAVNFLIGLILLAGIPFLLNRIQLPSSLLPQEYIVDFGHYAREFQEFFQGLQSFAPPASDYGGYLAPNLPESDAGRAIIAYKNNLIMRPLLITLGGAAFAGVIIVAEKFIIARRSIPKLPKGKNA